MARRTCSGRKGTGGKGGATLSDLVLPSLAVITIGAGAVLAGFGTSLLTT
jgi:hypothetical protein